MRTKTPTLLDHRVLGELYPIKLVGGFITVDYHIGCNGCFFCLCRRHPLWNIIFDRKLKLQPTCLKPAMIFELLRRMKPFTYARVPIRFGHNTDAYYQWEAGRGLYAMLLPDNIFIMLTRFPVSRARRQMFTGQKNLILKLTITPPSNSLRFAADIKALLETGLRNHPVVVMTRFPLSQGQRTTVADARNLLVHLSLAPLRGRLAKDHIPPETVIESVNGLDTNKLLFMFRPLTIDNHKHVIPILELLPSGANVSFRNLNTDHIPGMKGLSGVGKKRISALKRIAGQKGFKVWDYFGCCLRSRMGLPFFRFTDICVDRNSSCQWCPNHTVCRSRTSDFNENALRHELPKMNIGFTEISRRTQMVIIKTRQPTARAEEIYLSELFTRDIRLSSIRRRQTSGILDISREIIARWEITGFYPVGEMISVSRRIVKALSL